MLNSDDYFPSFILVSETDRSLLDRVKYLITDYSAAGFICHCNANSVTSHTYSLGSHKLLKNLSPTDVKRPHHT